jgi:predicted O-methyltransferase YrrM
MLFAEFGVASAVWFFIAEFRLLEYTEMASMPAEYRNSPPVEGQLNSKERELLTCAILNASQRPKIAVEVGTWLGGGSTLHILRALERNGCGHLWGIEADRSIYERMLANLRAGAPETVHRFTPLFGFSQDVIPRWLSEQGHNVQIDFVFLDGGNNPLEQITEFKLLEPHISIGGQLMAHDAKLRKGKWLGPYLRHLDNWRTTLHDVSDEGLLHATKIASRPSAASSRAGHLFLLRARLNPAELAASVLPASACAFVLNLLPRQIAMRLSDGRKHAVSG